MSEFQSSMSRASVRRRAVWMAPVLVTAAVVVGAAVASSNASGAIPSVAARTPAQLLTAMGTNASTAFSGTISQTSNLGLPSLPGDTSTASLSWASFVTGSHSIRVWADGPAKQRIAVIGQLSEADVIHDGKDLWTYTSDTNSVTHTVLGTTAAHEPDRATEAAPTPAALANRVLKAIDPTTSVTLGTPQTVAGQSAYTLVISPRSTDSTVKKVVIAVDSTHFVPLLVDVFGSSSTPALHLGFTDISFSTPPASTFAFKVPAGAQVSTNPFTDTGHHHFRSEGVRHAPGSTAPLPARPDMGTRSAAPRVLGTGWTSVVELHNGLSAVGGFGGLLDQATTPVGTAGARLLHTALLNAVILPDGRVFAGAVRPVFLEHLAATTAG